MQRAGFGDHEEIWCSRTRSQIADGVFPPGALRCSVVGCVTVAQKHMRYSLAIKDNDDDDDDGAPWPTSRRGAAYPVSMRASVISSDGLTARPREGGILKPRP